MWIFVKRTGRTELVWNEDTIARLLGEDGNHEVEDPRVKPEPVQQSELLAPVVSPPEHAEEEAHEHVGNVTDINKRRRRKA